MAPPLFRRVLGIALLLVLAASARAQVAAVRFATVPFRPSGPTVAGSQAELRLEVDAVPGQYEATATRVSDGQVASSRVFERTLPGGAFDGVRMAVPLEEGPNQFRVTVAAISGAGSRTTTASPNLIRELVGSASSVSLDSSVPAGRVTSATQATLVFTVDGTASTYEIVATNSFASTAVTTVQIGTGEGRVVVPLVANSPNVFTLSARGVDPPFGPSAPVTSGILTLTQDQVAPVVTGAQVTFPILPTGNAVASVQGQTEPFSRVFITNDAGDVFQGESDILGTFLIHGVFLPLIPPGPTSSDLTVSAVDQAGNAGPPSIVPVVRLATDPRFDILTILGGSGQFVTPAQPVFLRAAVGDDSAPFEVRFTIRAGSGAFAREEAFSNLRAGDILTKDFFLSPLVSAPQADVTYSLQAQVVSTAGVSAEQFAGEVVLDAADPPAPSLSTRFDGRVFSRSRLLTVEGTAERFAAVDFEPIDGVRFVIDRSVKVESTPVLDGGEFKQTIDLASAVALDLEMMVRTVARSGRTGPESLRRILLTRDTVAPRTTSLQVDRTPEGSTRPVFVRPAQSVVLRVTVDEPMPTAPDVFVTERGLDALPALVQSSEGDRTIFEYAYVLTPRPGAVNSPDDVSDGNVEIVISGGADRAGNAMVPVRFTSPMIKDSLAPVLDPLRSLPAAGSVVGAGQSTVLIGVQEHPFSADPSSGVDVGRCEVRVFGPLETTPTQRRTGVVAPLAPRTLEFRFDPGQFLAEGTYQFQVDLVDFAGNRETGVQVLRLDSTPIDGRFLLATNPAGNSCVSRTTLATDSAGNDVFSARFDPVLGSELSLAMTTMSVQLLCPLRSTLAGTTAPVTATTSVAFTPRVNLSGTGSDDGLYALNIFLSDAAGNITPDLIRTFGYDTQPPFVLDGDVHSVGRFGLTTENAFWPPTDGIVNGPLRTFRAGITDAVALSDFTGCGINASPTTGTVAVLTLRGAFPGTTLPVGSSTTNTPSLTSVLRLEQIESGLSSPCFLGLRRANVLVEIGTDAISAAPAGLPADGSADGIWEILVTPVDRAGNRGTTALSRFLYDTRPPTLLLNSVAADGLITSSTIRLTGVTFDEAKPPTDFGLGVVSVRIKVEQAVASQATTRPPLLDWTEASLPSNFRLTNAATPLIWEARGPLPKYEGPGRVVVQARDKAGNIRELLRDVTVQTDLLPPPKLRLPRDESAVASAIVTFTWSQVEGASLYRLTVTTPRGDRIVRDTLPQFPTATLNLVDEAVGTYHWTVQAVDTQGQVGVPAGAFDFGFDTVPPRVLRLFAFDPVLPDAQGGPVLDHQVRVGVTFSEPMDTTTTPLVEVFPALYGSASVILTPLSYDRTEYRGLVRIPQTAGSPDVNGLARVRVSGARDLAGNLLQVTEDFFEVRVGPFFEVRAFVNPVNRRELLFHFKALSFDSGPLVTLTAPPTVVVTQLGGVRRVLGLRKIRDSVWAGPYAVDPTRPGTATVEVNGTDLEGNSTTRSIAFDVHNVVARARAGLVARTGSWRMAIPDGAVNADETVVILPTSMSPTTPATLPGSELTLAAALDSMNPVVPLGVEAVVEVDLVRAGLGDPATWAGLGLYRLDGPRPVLVSGPVTNGHLNGLLDRLAPMALLHDRKAPQIEERSPRDSRGDFLLDAAEPALDFAVTDLGSGVDLTRVECKVDGVAWTPRMDISAGTVRFTGPVGTGKSPAVAVAVSDQAGNVVTRQYKAVAPEPLAVRQLVAWPNPSRIRSVIRYTLTQPATRCRLAIYDMAGRRVWTADGSTAIGSTDLPWDLVDDGGGPVASGVYVARLTVVGATGNRVRRDTKIAVMR